MKNENFKVKIERQAQRNRSFKSSSQHSGKRVLRSNLNFSLFTFHFKLVSRRFVNTPALLLALLFFPALPLFASPPPSLPAGSLYQLESTWIRDDGEVLRLADLRGKTRVLTLFFSRCDNICPMLTGQLKMLEREMPPKLLEHVGFVLVTLDPEEDDAETLADYRRRMDFPERNWVLLQGAPDDTRELANLLGVTYMPKKSDGQIDHNGLIVVLDAEGRIVEKTSAITDRKTFLKLLERTTRKAR